MTVVELPQQGFETFGKSPYQHSTRIDLVARLVAAVAWDLLEDSCL